MKMHGPKNKTKEHYFIDTLSEWGGGEISSIKR